MEQNTTKHNTSCLVPKKVLIVAALPKSPHYVLREARSLAVQLEVAVATPQSAPSPLASTLPIRHAIIDVAFRSGVRVRDASCSLPVCRQAFLYLRGLALNFKCSMQRLPRFDTSENSLFAAARSSHEQSRSSCSRT